MKRRPHKRTFTYKQTNTSIVKKSKKNTNFLTIPLHVGRQTPTTINEPFCYLYETIIHSASPRISNNLRTNWSCHNLAPFVLQLVALVLQLVFRSWTTPCNPDSIYNAPFTLSLSIHNMSTNDILRSMHLHAGPKSPSLDLECILGIVTLHEVSARSNLQPQEKISATSTSVWETIRDAGRSDDSNQALKRSKSNKGNLDVPYDEDDLIATSPAGGDRWWIQVSCRERIGSYPKNDGSSCWATP